MKRSLRLPFSLLFAVAVLALLSFRAAFLRLGFRGYSPELYVPLNETLLRLSADDPGEAALQKDAKNLLDGNLPSAARRRGIHRHPHETPSRIRRRSPKDYSRALRDWLSSRRFQPAVMEELITQVKGAAPAAAARYTSCAVVGNSGILLRRDDGDLIDGHEIVIRLNNARITGYQRHTGSKTSISFINSNILHLCARRNGCYCHPYGDIPIVMYICQAVHFLDYALCNSSHKSPLLITDPRFDLLCARITKYYSLKRFVRETGRPPEEWSKVHDELMFHYSSGMQAVMLALGICDQVSVFGFGKSPEARHHYHTNQKAELDLHDYEAEYEFYGDLVERPQVIPFLGDSGFKVPPVVFYR